MRALALVALLLIGCATTPPSVASTPQPTHEPNALNVSVLLDLSGPRAPSGQPQRDAMQTWLDLTKNDATATKLRVKFVDVASSESKLLLELRRAVVSERADAVVVGVSVAGDDSFAEAADVARVPVLLTLPAPEPVSGRLGTWVFALAPSPSIIAVAIASDIVDRGIAAPMLLATDESAPANVERAAFVADLGRRHIDAPKAVEIGGTEGPTRIRLATPIAKSAVFAGPAASYGDLIRPLAPRAPTEIARIYLSYLTETADLVSLKDASAFVTWPGSRWISAISNPPVPGTRAEFLRIYGDQHGAPSTLAATAFDALALLDWTVRVAPSDFDAAHLRQRLEANTFGGVVTTYRFTSSRHVGFRDDDLALLVWDRQRGAAMVPPSRAGDR